jgi:hypothetical protein
MAQADNEIQVYSSPITDKNITFFELHSNYTFRGPDGLADPSSVHYLNESLEITHGFGGNFELGFYVFTAVLPNGHYAYLGNHIRPRFTAPDKWHLPFGASLSVEFGFWRPDPDTKFQTEGEIRPIIDKNVSNWYFSFNPNIAFVLNGAEKRWELTPQLKTVYTIHNKVGVGIEYYTALGTFEKILPVKEEEHLLGPMLDLYVSPRWELNTGWLFGLTPGSNHSIVKLLLGRRVGGK